MVIHTKEKPKLKVKGAPETKIKGRNVTYIMIRGEVQENFNIYSMKKIIDLLFHIQQNLGFYSIPSIYKDIINNAEDVLKSNTIFDLGHLEIIRNFL